MSVDQKNARAGKAKKESQPLIIAKTPAEEQRLKLERLMRNPVSLYRTWNCCANDANDQLHKHSP